jgi:hypothetical protein
MFLQILRDSRWHTLLRNAKSVTEAQTEPYLMKTKIHNLPFTHTKCIKILQHITKPHCIIYSDFVLGDVDNTNTMHYIFRQKAL